MTDKKTMKKIIEEYERKEERINNFHGWAIAYFLAIVLACSIILMTQGDNIFYAILGLVIFVGITGILIKILVEAVE